MPRPFPDIIYCAERKKWLQSVSLRVHSNERMLAHMIKHIFLLMHKCLSTSFTFLFVRERAHSFWRAHFIFGPDRRSFFSFGKPQ
jgi:hypothetical protein